MTADRTPKPADSDTPIYDDLVRTVLGGTAVDSAKDDSDKAPDGGRRRVVV